MCVRHHLGPWLYWHERLMDKDTRYTVCMFKRIRFNGTLRGWVGWFDLLNRIFRSIFKDRNSMDENHNGAQVLQSRGFQRNSYTFDSNRKSTFKSNRSSNPEPIINIITESYLLCLKRYKDNIRLTYWKWKYFAEFHFAAKNEFRLLVLSTY